jgi:hypothetical protein
MRRVIWTYLSSEILNCYRLWIIYSHRFHASETDILGWSALLSLSGPVSHKAYRSPRPSLASPQPERLKQPSFSWLYESLNHKRRISTQVAIYLDVPRRIFRSSESILDADRLHSQLSGVKPLVNHLFIYLHFCFSSCHVILGFTTTR